MANSSFCYTEDLTNLTTKIIVEIFCDAVRNHLHPGGHGESTGDISASETFENAQMESILSLSGGTRSHRPFRDPVQFASCFYRLQ